MKNQLFVSTLVICVLCASSAFASTTTPDTVAVGASLKNTVKQAGQETKDTFKNLGESVKTDVANSSKEVKKQKIETLKQQKKVALDDMDLKIKAKKAQIADVKKSTTMLETQKIAKITVYEKELEYLQSRKDAIEISYNKKIDALK